MADGNPDLRGCTRIRFFRFPLTKSNGTNTKRQHLPCYVI